MATPSLKPPGNSSRQSHAGGNSNFAKALLEAGGHVVQSGVDSGVQMASDVLGSLFGAGTGSSLPQNQADNGENFPQSLESQNALNPEQQEMEWRQREMQMLRHREVQQTPVFDAREVEKMRKIEEILEQLKRLAEELTATDRNSRDAQIAIMQGAVRGGDYHIAFFQHLLNVVILLRKQVKEANSWLETFNSKKSAKKGYWGQFYANGTQWAMSSERAIATSVG